MPLEGYRSLASKLGGGDYDGDRVLAIWNPDVVENFTPTPDEGVMDPSPEVLASFEKSPQRVGDLLDKMADQAPSDWDTAFRRCFLAPLTVIRLHGAYSLYLVYSCYVNGVGHPDSVRLAHLVCQLLDAPKSGLRLRGDVRAADAKLYDKPLPQFYKEIKAKEEKKDVNAWAQEQGANEHAKRPDSLPQHACDYVRNVSRKHFATIRSSMERKVEAGAQHDIWQAPVSLPGAKKAESQRRPKGCPITAYWTAFVERAQSDAKELEDVKAIMKHVGVMNTRWRSARKGVPMSPRKDRPKVAMTRSKIASNTSTSSADTPSNVATVAKAFRCALNSEHMQSRTLRHDPHQLDLLKAAAAFDQFPRDRFAGDVAFGDLCEIKAKSSRNATLVVDPIFSALSVDKRMVERASVHHVPT